MLNAPTNAWWVVLVAIACNVVAQISLQQAHIHNLRQWQLWWQPMVALALGSYAISFILTAWLYARFPLSVLVPTMASGIFVLLVAYDVWWLGHGMSHTRALGIALVVLGLYFIHRTHGA